MPLTENKLFKINVSEDKLTAVLAVNGQVPLESCSADCLVAEIAPLGIILDEQARKTIAEFAAALAAQNAPEPMVVARGTPPEHDQNGRIEKLYKRPGTGRLIGDDKNPQGKSPLRLSHYERSNIIAVKKGQPLVRLLPPVTGKDGRDVFGKPISRKLGREVKIKLGANVEQKGDTVLATESGKLEYSHEKIWVDPKLEINGDVDFSVGNIDFAGEVFISGNVLDLFKVRSRSSIIVQGVIQAADVHAEEDIYAAGGIVGKEKGHFWAGRDLKSKYITNATAHAGQNIEVHTELVNCHLVCNGQVIVENGPLVGGTTMAMAGVKVKHLGSEAGTPTFVEAGVDVTLKQKVLEIAPEVEKRRKLAAKVRQVVEPLLRYQKSLTREQKEKATELLNQAREIDDSVTQLIEQLRQLYQETQEKAVPEVEVAGVLHAGVTIRFPRVEITIKDDLKGPMKIVPKNINGILKIVAIDIRTHASHVLGVGQSKDNFWDTLEGLLGALGASHQNE